MEKRGWQHCLLAFLLSGDPAKLNNLPYSLQILHSQPPEPHNQGNCNLQDGVGIRGGGEENLFGVFWLKVQTPFQKKKSQVQVHIHS